MTPTTYRKLQNKHVLIIGGSSGIGAAVADAALSDGAIVTISSSSQSKLDSQISTLTSLYPGTSIRGVAKDLLASRDPSTATTTLKSDLDSLFQQAIAAQNNTPINHVIYTAADALSLTPIQEITPELIHQASHMRFVVPLLLAAVAASYLPLSHTSSLTLTSGSTDTKPTGKHWSLISYFAGGLVSLTRGLAVDMAPVRVNVVRPGVVDTELWGFMSEEEREDWRRGVEGRMPTGVVGRREDVAEAYVWLMKDGNVTGTVAGTDSGALLV